jgi:hypothetical protein
MDIAAVVRMHLSAEEGAVLGQLAHHPDGVTRFTPASRTKPEYRRFNAEIVWPLEQLKHRGLVAITGRTAAPAEPADMYWEAVVAALTPAGRRAFADEGSSELLEPLDDQT